MSSDDLKKKAALAALDYVKPGMIVGLGTGSTANHFTFGLAAKVKAGLEITCVATSKATFDYAKSLGLKLVTLDQQPVIDLTVDGADEIAPDLSLIKGGGGALLLEKMVATSSKNVIIIADGSKLVKMLGKFPLPLEIIPVGAKTTAWKLEHAFKIMGLKAKMTLRLREGKPFVTDLGHFIIDCALGEIPDPRRADALLNTVPGVVDTGLFIQVAKLCLIGTKKGVEILKPA
jgi:ribose 5-phosphate isomerase A